MKVFFYFILAGIGIAGCYTQKKAVKQVNHALIEYKDTTLKILRAVAPCIETTNGKPDSTEYKQYLADIKSLQDFYESQEPQRITDTFRLAWADSTKIKYLQKELRYKDNVIASRDAEIEDWAKLCRDKPPIHDTTKVYDSAQVYLLLNNIDVLEGQLMEAKADNQKKTDSRDWWRKWCLITWGILVLLGTGWLLAKKFKPL